MKVKDIALDGVVRQNPTFRLVLGTCPTLALTTAAFNGIGMGLSVTFVLICSNVLVSLLRKIIPDKVRIPAFVLIMSSSRYGISSSRRIRPKLISALPVSGP